MEAHKQLKTKTCIPTSTNDSKGTKHFTRDEKTMMVEELAELVIHHMEFCGMDSEFYLPDPHNNRNLQLRDFLVLWQLCQSPSVTEKCN